MREREEVVTGRGGSSSHGSKSGPNSSDAKDSGKRRILKPDSYFSDEDASDHDQD